MSTTPAPPAAPGSGDAPPQGAAAADAASRGKDLSPGVQHNALAYYMGEAPPPGSASRFTFNVDLGTPDEPNFQPHTFRQLGAEEITKCQQLAEVKDAQGMVERVDPFRRWCYVFAYACVEPNLGELFLQRQQAGTAGQLKDAGGLVAEVFRFQPGVLQNVTLEVERRSRFGEDKSRSFVEVEGGKTSL